MFRCTSRCVTCQEHILQSDSFKSHSTSAHHMHKIRGHISNIIYLISCRICGIQYIGETKNSLKKRFYGHRSTVKTHKLDTPVGQHFNLPHHSISGTILQGIEALSNSNRRESVRLSREKMWIRRVHTIHPMVSTYRKEMTNFPLFSFSTEMFIFILHWFYICFTFVLLINFGWTKNNLLERDLYLRPPDWRTGALPTELTIALYWRSPYFVNIFVRGRQSEVMKPYTAL